VNALEYEAWRPALIAYYRAESPWMVQKLQNLRNGYPLNDTDRSVIDGLRAVAGRREAA